MDAVVIGHDVQAIRERAGQAGRRVVATLLRALLSAALFTVFYLVARRQHMGGFSVLLLLLGWLPTLAIIMWSGVQYLRARSQLRRLGPGPALVISRTGIEGFVPGTTATERMPWPAITSVRGVHRPLLPGGALVCTCSDGRRWSVPLGVLDQSVAGIDNAIRVYSGGRHGLDVSALAL